ncbi:MAG: alkyl sulfatase dimerization domain-containing protein [Halioglobus sp.]
MPTFLTSRQILLMPLFVLLIACGGQSDDTGAQGNSAASEATIAANKSVREELDFNDQQDFEDARRGLIAAPEGLTIEGPGGVDIWDMPSYSFIDGEAPDTVNPSLWRQATLNNIHGLFEVTEGVYQLRGFDLSNMSLIKGDTGWIVVDPLTTRETATAGMAFVRKHLGDAPVTAVIFTHSHIDHFGGVLGVLDAAENVEIVAPVGFMEEATSENVLAGNTMSRRSMYMYGSRLEHSARGHVDSGLGKSPAFGSPGIAAPTRIIDTTGEKVVLDGVEFIFQNAPGSEAPAELTFYLPEKNAFCGAEVVSRNMHNLYTLRGAKVRDARLWSHYINEAMNLFPDTQVYFGSHHWPMWGNEAITDFLKKQRDGYKYIHDQTLRLASQGYTPREIADQLQMPETLRSSFPNRGYYGTLKHNAKAVYQRYFGWYDGNPANLDPLPPEESAVRYVKMMGGAEEILEQAESDFEDGEYRWVAQMLNHLVFAEPDNQAAKSLLARTYDQMGYQAESGPWRDVYLTGALELRRGAPEVGAGIANAVDLIRATPVDQFFELMAVMLNGPKADGREYMLNIEFTDLQESFVLELENSVLHHRAGVAIEQADASIRITHALFVKMLTGGAGISEVLFSDEVSFDGGKVGLLRFFALLDSPDEIFEIVTP